MAGVDTRWRLLTVLVVVVALALPVGVFLAARHRRAAPGPPLPALATVRPTLDRVVAEVAVAVGTDAAVALTAVVPATGCTRDRRTGTVYTRGLDIYTNRGGEDGLLGTIAGRLPAGYHARRGTPAAGGAAPLTADPGGGVQLTVRQLGQGWLTATARTDCRGGTVTSAPAQASPDPAVAATVTAILGRLHTGAVSWRRAQVTCPAGTSATTVALSGPTGVDDLPDRVGVPATAREFAGASGWVAYRDGATSVVAAPTDDGSAVTVRYTSGC